ncbi:MAG TPA: class I SAM-dependent methyltransferase [Nitrospinota bacterium]|jgi:ubiquinone/menaquinone biosynthesis C-methylase UbiE|nr:class I SAM-dependent methyltransferase [Nitrospinota bacterium]|tara:strand:- start:99 stop:911 length:813 start_codon:yes stop_codon:yes gene_type:complete
MKTPDSKLYTKEYFLSTEGIDYFKKGIISPKFEHAINMATLRSGMKILDIGCGRGDIVLASAKKSVYSFGIDYAHDSIEIAKTAKQSLPDSMTSFFSVHQASGDTLPFKKCTFDKIFFMDVAEHLSPADLLQCFKECKRTLKENGELIIHTSPNRWYNDFGNPLWERPVNKILNRIFKQNLLTRKIRNKTDLKVHINEQTIFSLKNYLKKSGFQSKVWLGNEYTNPVKKSSLKEQILELARQVICHLYPFSLIFPLNLLFSNNIWAVAKK